jgi:hypothetical protein
MADDAKRKHIIVASSKPGRVVRFSDMVDLLDAVTLEDGALRITWGHGQRRWLSVAGMEIQLEPDEDLVIRLKPAPGSVFELNVKLEEG